MERSVTFRRRLGGSGSIELEHEDDLTGVTNNWLPLSQYNDGGLRSCFEIEDEYEYDYTAREMNPRFGS